MHRSRVAPVLIFMLTIMSATGCMGAQTEGDGDATAQDAAHCASLEIRTPNAPDQRPAFAGQTRACGVPSKVAFDVVVIAKELNKPWAVEPLPGGDVLITEKGGNLRIVSVKGEVGSPIAADVR